MDEALEFMDLLHQSGGCCDESSPMCYPRGDFRVGNLDVLLGPLFICRKVNLNTGNFKNLLTSSFYIEK